tara:strand:- start:1671 stop:2675 length:1005 start_codon:yes stop_codon:yes gene_type:complete
MSTSTLKICKAKIKEKKRVRNFILNSFYKKKHILAINSKLFNWQYVNDSLSCSIAVLKLKIIGLQLYIPLAQFDKSLKKNKEIFTSLWFTKKTEIISLGAKIFDYTLKTNKPNLIIGMGIPPYLISFHKKNNFIIEKMSHHFMFSPGKEILTNKKNFYKLNICKISSIADLKNKKINKLFNYQFPKKSLKYLDNRFIKHPVYKYFIYSISYKKEECLCVFRVVRHGKKNIIRIVDYVGSNSFIKYLKNFYLHILDKYKSIHLDFYSYGLSDSFLKEGGLKNKKNYKNLIIPNHFEPFENKNVDIMIAYLSLYKKNSNIRLFKADSDMDRPHFIG